MSIYIRSYVLKSSLITAPTVPCNLHYTNPNTGITSSVTYFGADLIYQMDSSLSTMSVMLLIITIFNKFYCCRYHILVQTHKVKFL